MSFNLALSAPNKRFTTTNVNNTSFNSTTPDMDVEEIFKKYAGD